MNEILEKGAIEIVKLESGLTYDDDDCYYRFTIHPTGDGPKPPVAMFVTDALHVQPGPKANFLVLSHEVGDGAFYFGLIFSSERKMNTFLQALTVIEVKRGIGYSGMARDITEKLFKKYK